jgi:hypothetical protein
LSTFRRLLAPVAAVLSVAGLVLVAFMASPPAHAGTVPQGLITSRTGVVRSDQPDQSTCCTDPLKSSPTTYRTYLQFGLSSIPADATVTSVTLNWFNVAGGLTSGVEVHPATASSFNEGPGSGEATCHSDASPCLTWNNQPYDSSVLATSGVPAANSVVSVSLPTSSVTPGASSVVFALRSLTSGVIDTISGAFAANENGPTLQVTYTDYSSAQALSGAAYTDATTGNTTTNHGGANPLKSSPSSYYAWLQFDLSGCQPGSCGIPSGASVTGGQLAFFNDTSGEAAVDVHATTADNWVPGTGGNAGDTTCHLNTPPCLVFANQPYSSSVLSTYTFPGSSLNAAATVSVPSAGVHAGGFTSFALKGTTAGLVDTIDNGSHPATLKVQYSDTPVTAVTPDGLCSGGLNVAHTSKVMVIYEENRQASQIYGKSNAPYINDTIGSQCGSATNFTALASGGHSLSNYLMSSDGQNLTGLGVTGDSAGSSTNSLCSNNCISTTNCAAGQTAPCWTAGTPDVVPGSVNNATTGFFPAHGNSYQSIYDQVGSSGWKAYGESMPSNCYIANTGSDSTGDAYAPRHIPSLYYTSLNGGNTFSGTNCGSGTTMAANAVPLASTTNQAGTYTAGNLWNDVQAGTLPEFSTVTPNLCDDMHDGCSSTGGDTFTANCGSGPTTDGTCIADQWLAGIIPMITSGPDYQSGNLAIVIVWDEGGSVPLGTTPWPYTCAQYSQTCVAALVLSRQTTPVVSSTAFNDWSITRTADDILGKTELGNSSSVNSMVGPFGL